METIILIIFISVFGIIIIDKINQANRQVGELKDEIKRLRKTAGQPVGEKEAVKHEAVESTPELPPVPETIFTEPKPDTPAIPDIPDEDTPPPLPAFVSEDVTPSRPRKKANYEKYIGENLFGKIGILILVAGIGFFVKYAIDQNWINEVMRTALGFVCGAVLLLLAGRLKKKYRGFSSLLAGGAFAVFYVTVAVAYHYYTLFSQPVAFAILVLITIGMSVLAILYDHRELSIIALLGGFIAPFLVSTGQGNYLVLFTYILILNTGMFALSLTKRWGELPVISFVLTAFVLGLFTVKSYGSPEVISQASTALPSHMLIFTTLFYFIFLLPLLSILRNEKKAVNKILLLLIAFNNFVYLGFGLYYLQHIPLTFKADGLLSLFIALVNGALLLGLHKEKRDNKLLTQAFLALTVTFVTITIPLQLNGNWITLLFAAEMVVLFWLFVKTRIRMYEYFSFTLTLLTLLFFILSFAKDLTPIKTDYVFVTGISTGLAFAFVAVLSSHYRSVLDKAVLLRYNPWNRIMIILSVVIIYFVSARKLGQIDMESETWLKSQLLFAAGYLFMLTIILCKRFPIGLNTGFYKTVLFFITLFFAVDSYLIQVNENDETTLLVLSWAIALVAILAFSITGWQYYTKISQPKLRPGFTTYFVTLSILCWLTLENLFIQSVGIKDESSAGLSIALSLAGFTLMALGMRLHFKVLRKLSLMTLAIVLAKLILVDLWAMPTVGKIIVFIFLGVTLLILSFLYQKLKTVLFGEDDKKEEEDEDW